MTYLVSGVSPSGHTSVWNYLPPQVNDATPGLRVSNTYDVYSVKDWDTGQWLQ